MHKLMKLLCLHSGTPILAPPFWHPQACEGEGGAEGLVGKAEEDPPGVRDHLLDGHGDLLGGQDDVHDDFGIESQICPFKFCRRPLFLKCFTFAIMKIFVPLKVYFYI